VEQAGPDIEATVRANVLLQAARLREDSPLLAELIDAGKLKVAAGYFDLRNGEVTLLGEGGV
jgi:carbonic anhydrase